MACKNQRELVTSGDIFAINKQEFFMKIKKILRLSTFKKQNIELHQNFSGSY